MQNTAAYWKHQMGGANKIDLVQLCISKHQAHCLTHREMPVE